MIAVAAMAANRVIGVDGKIPWHLPEDLRWFKELTMGGTLLMGRVTYDSIGKPLPGRTTIVMSRQDGLIIPGVQVIRDLSGLPKAEVQGEVFVVGGTDSMSNMPLYFSKPALTEVKREVAGDRRFPMFEELFRFSAVLRETPEMRVVHYVNDEVLPLPRTRAEAPP